MAEQQDVEEIEDDDLEGPDGGDEPPSGPKSKAAAAKSKAHLAKVAGETAELNGLDPAALNKVLREVIAGSRQISTEALVRICAGASRAGNRLLVNLSFEAVTKTATPLLLSQAFGQAEDERREQVQEILLQLFAAIRAGKSQLPERFFAKFAKRRSIDLFRRRDARFEAKSERSEPVAEADPVDELPDLTPSLEDRVLLSVAVDKLPPKLRTAFIQKHQFGMTKEEIAEQNGVDVRTVYSWLAEAATLLGLKGEEE
ncbi:MULTISPECIES: RNA polymerase sigma factor [unclassified Afipia]|uniref:RNA polymerase sigma factor n=1 Tax=unclassified Afipia TaxID=2642050 RepID=UPI0003FD8B8A|nr:MULTISPECIES: RNA polymerase sigma factor [unclassified Afipia]